MLNGIKLSLRNLARYRTRTAITIIAVLVSVLVSTIVDGFVRGISNVSTLNLLLYESSEVSVYKKGYFEKREEYDNDHLINADELKSASKLFEKEKLPNAPRFKAAADIIYYSEDEDAEFDINAVLVGVDEEKDKNVFEVYKSISDGEWLGNYEGVVVGSKIAEKLKLSVGSLLTISTTGAEGFMETFEEEVIGIVNTEDPVVNSSQIFMRQSDLDDYLLLDGAVSEIEVSDGKVAVASASFAKKASSLLANTELEAYYYQDVNDGLMAVMNGDKGGTYIVLIFLFIIAIAGISNTMIMAALERQKESAMLRALGFSRGSVVSLFVYEGIITGVIGAAIGILLSVIVLYPMSRFGIDFTGLFTEDIDYGYRMPLIIRPGLYWQTFVIVPLLAIVLSALSAFIPVSRMGREEIAELFRRA